MILGRPRAAEKHQQHDRPIPVRAQIRQEHRLILGVETLGQATLLPDQARRCSRPAPADMEPADLGVNPATRNCVAAMAPGFGLIPRT